MVDSKPPPNLSPIVPPRLPRVELHGSEVQIIPVRLTRLDDGIMNRLLDDLERDRTGYAKRVLPVLMHRYPLDFEILEAKARVYELESDFAGAIPVLQESIASFMASLAKIVDQSTAITIPWKFDDNRAFLRTMHMLGMFLWYEAMDEAAINQFVALLALDPGDTLGSRYFILHLAILHDLSDVALAIPRIMGVDGNPESHLDPKHDQLPGMFFAWGLFHYIKGEQEEARDFFERGIKVHPLIVIALFRHFLLQFVSSESGFDESSFPAPKVSFADDYVEDWVDVWGQHLDALDYLVELAIELNFKVVSEPHEGGPGTGDTFGTGEGIDIPGPDEKEDE
jgi:tetratricopeptide (TPR) repeat protein